MPLTTLMVFVSELVVVERVVCVVLVDTAVLDKVVMRVLCELMLVFAVLICVLWDAYMLVATLVEAWSAVIAVARLVTWEATELMDVLMDARVGTRELTVPETLKSVVCVPVRSVLKVLMLAVRLCCERVARDVVLDVATLALVAIDSVVVCMLLRTATVLLRAERLTAKERTPVLKVASTEFARETSRVRSVRTEVAVLERTATLEACAFSTDLARDISLSSEEARESIREVRIELKDTSAAMARDVSVATLARKDEMLAL